MCAPKESLFQKLPDLDIFLAWIRGSWIGVKRPSGRYSVRLRYSVSVRVEWAFVNASFFGGWGYGFVWAVSLLSVFFRCYTCQLFNHTLVQIKPTLVKELCIFCGTARRCWNWHSTIRGQHGRRTGHLLLTPESVHCMSLLVVPHGTLGYWRKSYTRNIIQFLHEQNLSRNRDYDIDHISMRMFLDTSGPNKDSI